MQEKDLRPDFADDQTSTSTRSASARRRRQRLPRSASAELGGGLTSRCRTAKRCRQALVDALNDIVEKSRSFTAATVPSARTADGGDFYNSFFLPSDRTAFWEGHLRAWHFTAAGEILDSDGHCALVDPDGGTSATTARSR